MKAQQAVAARIEELMMQHHISISGLSSLSGVPKSVLHGTLVGNPPRVKNTSIITIQRICQALNITLREFFDCDLFSDIEYEEEKE